MLTNRIISATANAYLDAVAREVDQGQYHIKYRGVFVDDIMKLEDHKYVIYLAYLNDEEIRTEGMTVGELVSLMGDFSVVIE
ncbi:hypothetical protein AVV29_gp055 [Vibrio phage phi 3]|uniref:Uncharacterized protein n=1 Tax=Vibrio phage phi 3 TaxID=1589298 RepID=A0A0B5H938_9CAUD|nr:hypothetical protein AVV29_gp011 [Vibrio phage phi 3]YP_009207621.1 hypothetical protein AVV29_gp055 [Vibrio phage phi 3]AJF40779.1 hypothetical protein SBVP3_0011 [Vibrio phage phi 3]AJF40923.1 hypothetical protein SBVP3_00156 [Vibrio phage phi 3]